MRADAQRNRDQLLAAARDVFVEQGPNAALDDIARRAGVGIATLYRRFPGRAALIRAVALDVLVSVGNEAWHALAEEPDAFRALARYMHRALDARIAAVFPALLGDIPFEDADIQAARTRATQPLQQIIDTAQAEGTLRRDVAFGDIGLVLIRLSRPLPGPFPPALETNLAHRHLDLFIAGLRSEAESASEPLAGPSMTLGQLQGLGSTEPNGTP
jgi:AcrR family transcriptional regulator